MSVSPVSEIVTEIRAGRMVVLVDEEDRENEGDLVMAAQFVTPDAINFMAKYGRGLICLAITEERCRQLSLEPMVSRNRSQMGTNFTVSIEAASGVTTGISAADRAHTVLTAVRKDAKPNDLVQPGHIFPLMAQRGGVLVRAGHTEAGTDLAAMAGAEPAAVICEILKDDGEMARLPDLLEFAQAHNIKIGTISDLIQYRSRTESLVARVYERTLRTMHGEFRVIAYVDKTTDETHLALTRGAVAGEEPVLVRVHEPLSAIDALDAAETVHSWNLNDALRAVSRAGRGVIVLLHRTETGADLLAVLKSEPGTLPRRKMDLRTYGIGAQILRDLGVKRMRLLAHPRKMPSMTTGFDLEVVEYVEHDDQSINLSVGD